MLIGCLLSSAANCCLAGRFPPSHCRGRLFASRAVRPDNNKQVGRIHTSFRFQSHASPCLQGEGRVGIRGRQLDTIKARANSQKPKIGLYEFARACTDHWCLLHPSPTPPLQAREGMRSVTLVCTIHRNTHAHYLAGMGAAPTGESGVRQLPGCVTKLAAGPARRVAQRFHKPVGRYGMILLFFK